MVSPSAALVLCCTLSLALPFRGLGLIFLLGDHLILALYLNVIFEELMGPCVLMSL